MRACSSLRFPHAVAALPANGAARPSFSSHSCTLPLVQNLGAQRERERPQHTVPPVRWAQSLRAQRVT